MRWSGPRKVAGGAPQARGDILRLRRAATVSRGPLNADVRFHLDALRQFFRGPYSIVEIDLSNKRWHVEAKVPRESGWYFIETDAPVDVLAQQALWDTEYVRATTGKRAPVRNYCIGSRAARFDPEAPRFWNPKVAYSGLASNLQNRAREHTFPDAGTGALALSRYPELAKNRWLFGFYLLSRAIQGTYDKDVVLLVGEQLWRVENGWPLLCAE